MSQIIISPSILAANAANLQSDIELVESTGVKFLHIDIMDGHFVPNLSFSADTVKAIRPISKLVFDVHLMVENPENFIEPFANAGADIITFHQECVDNIKDTIDMVKSFGKDVGISLNPSTPVETIFDFLEHIDQVLLMTVVPGFGGQVYIKGVEEKIVKLRKKIEELGLDINIEVDGGITVDNIKYPIRAGANVIVAGTAIFKSDNIVNTIELMKNIAEHEVKECEIYNI